MGKNPYRIIYDFFKYLPLDDEIYQKIDKNLIFDTEEIEDKEFYKEWFEYLKKYVRIDTVVSGICPVCGSRMWRTRIPSIDRTIYLLCRDCNRIFDEEEIE